MALIPLTDVIKQFDIADSPSVSLGFSTTVVPGKP
jgi:hypothetical protein